ncbi:MAG TPA: FMN-binding negative transcriptional regulator [Burkholderiaceae bacterium]|nr:FMN-binding negative transcriptional regulator [Burkholderiaceae bacterium]
MYVPAHFEQTDVALLHDLIRAFPLGAWVVSNDGELLVNHIPFLIDPTRGAHGTLVGHVARANPVWQTLSATANAVVIFQGAQGYVSPSWYPSKHAHGKAVPTWNYAVVHAHGTPRAIEERDWLLDLVTRLTATQEARQAVPWKVTDAPADYIERQLASIVGIEMPISKLVGKWKVSQNRPPADRLGVVAGLMARGDETSNAMAALVQKYGG